MLEPSTTLHEFCCANFVMPEITFLCGPAPSVHMTSNINEQTIVFFWADCVFESSFDPRGFFSQQLRETNRVRIREHIFFKCAVVCRTRVVFLIKKFIFVEVGFAKRRDGGGVHEVVASH